MLIDYTDRFQFYDILNGIKTYANEYLGDETFQFYDILNGIKTDVIKQLPQALENPLNVLKSDTKSDSIVVVT